jgi:superfamily II DNA helicase RecQ
MALPAPGIPLVIASLDQAVGAGATRLRSYLYALDAAGALAAIVLDECHLVLAAAAYRERMARVYELRGLRCQFVYLTATLPPPMEPSLAERLLLRSPAIVRGDTARADIRYRVHRLRGGDAVAEAIACIRVLLDGTSFQAEAAARAVVYCRRREEAERVARALHGSYYHAGSGTAAEKEEVVRRWTSASAGADAAAAAAAAYGGRVAGGHQRLHRGH